METYQHIPSCLFPIKNPITSSLLWVAIVPASSGIEVQVYSEKPHWEGIEHPERLPLDETHLMSTFYLDYFTEIHPFRETLKLNIWDGEADQQGGQEWTLPDGYGTRTEASLVLVDNVQAWKPFQPEQSDN